MHPDDICPDGAATIPMRARDRSIKAYAVVDATDAEWANQWRWCLTNGYVTRFEWNGQVRKKRMFYLHRELLGLTSGDGLEIDHLNHDRLDNRRGNLRVVTRLGQMQNVRSITGSSSKYRGVSFHAMSGKWRASIWTNGKSHYLGIFNTEEEAARVAHEARRVHMPFALD